MDGGVSLYQIGNVIYSVPQFPPMRKQENKKKQHDKFALKLILDNIYKG